MRASTSSTPSSAVEAAVAMFRVYCSCPGASATMKLRRAGRKIAIGDVDRNALLAFRLQPVDQQGQIELAGRGGTEARRIGGKRRQLILVEHPAVKQQAADQRRLAVVDGAAGEEPQQPGIRRPGKLP